LKSFFVIPVAAALIASCSEREAAPPSSSEKKETILHPSDWKPADPDLAAGRQIYMVECSLCHDEGEEGAPALSNKKQWSERSSKGLPTLTTHAIEGFIGDDGEMPARGGTDSLTDEEVGQAVRFMLSAALRDTTH